MSPINKTWLLLFALCTWPLELAAQESAAETVVVTGVRLPLSAGDAAYPVTRLDQDQLANAPSTRLDEILRQVPGFGLFRRASSLSAHPTTQGVTLRALGPNGAGRTLVLLNGVPLNDPFGGWVYWSVVAPELLDSVEIIKGAGAGRWGSGALAGTIELRTALPQESQAFAQARYGSFDTFEGRGSAALVGDGISVQVSGGRFQTDGFFLLNEAQRGPVDLPAASDNTFFNGRVNVDISDTITASLFAGAYMEDRINGLALSTNQTDAYDINFSLLRRNAEDGVDGELHFFYRKRDFASTFASVADNRTTTRQVLDQFDVPAEGIGVNGAARFPLTDALTLETGFDVRMMEGSTNENFRNLGAGFTRLRRAGGEQMLVGFYAELTILASDKLTLNFGARADHWKVENGFLVETEISDGSIVRNDIIPERNDWVGNARAGAVFDVNDNIHVRAAAYTGFRLPTINEFFRPFRVGNDITEANPLLRPERVYGIDLGVEFTSADNSHGVVLGYFRNWLKDGVGNVTLAFGPGFFPPTGFVPAGGVLRQRQNIDRIEADGVEITVWWQASDMVRLQGAYLFSNVRVTKNALEPALIGNRVPQSPKHQASFQVAFTPHEIMGGIIEARYVGPQFDDDLNTRTLAGFFVVNARAHVDVTKNMQLFVAAENLFDKGIQSAVSATGLITFASPRILSIGLKGKI